MKALACFVLVSVFCSALASAETRSAFVVGNGSYENAANLENPANDARLVASSLEAVGFDVTTHTDLTRAEFGRALSEFLEAQEDTDVVFFYFAGHGMQLDGENLLLGTDASLQSEFDVLAESIPLETVAEALGRRARSVLIFIDACRDNPLAENFYAANFPQTRTLDRRGLAEVSAPDSGAMFFFAASPGQVAYDGIGRNSAFSLALSRHLGTPGLEVLTMTKRVIADVQLLTNSRQTPTVTNDISAEIYLAGEQSDLSMASTLDQQAAAAWDDFRDSTSVEALTAFAEAYPDTAYATLALAAAAQLGSTQPPNGPNSAERPDWCSTQRNDTEALICSDPILIALHEDLRALNSNRLDAARSGEDRGAALVDQANWRRSRDTCGVDRQCIERSYHLRIIALEEFNGEVPPTALLVRSIQQELNRLSCGAGEPDGVLGAQTEEALDLAVSLAPGLDTGAELPSLELLAGLRSQSAGLCSYLLRAQDQPELLAGAWSIEQDPDCGSPVRIRIEPDGTGAYSGTMAYGTSTDFRRAIGGRLAGSSFSLVHVTPGGGRQLFYVEPGVDPDTFTGFTHINCAFTVTR